MHVGYVGYITYTCKGRYRSSNSGRVATTEGTPRARRTRLMLPEAARPSPAAAARVGWPLWPTQAPCGPHSSLHGGPDGHAAAAPRRHCALPERGKRGRVSRGRRRREARAAGRRQRQHPAAQRPRTWPHARTRINHRARRSPHASDHGGRKRGRRWRRRRPR